MKYVDDKAIIVEPCIFGKNVYIGPYSIIGPNVEIGDNTWIDSHVIIRGPIIIGSNNRFFSLSKVIVKCLNYNFSGKKFNIVIGNDNIFCEGFSIYNNFGFTVIGNKNYFMTNSFISSNCVLHDNIVLSQNVFLSSNVYISSFVILSEGVNIYSDVRIGSYTFIGDNSNIYSDILPYMLVFSYPSFVIVLNLVFLKTIFF